MYNAQVGLRSCNTAGQSHGTVFPACLYQHGSYVRKRDMLVLAALEPLTSLLLHLRCLHTEMLIWDAHDLHAEALLETT